MDELLRVVTQELWENAIAIKYYSFSAPMVTEMCGLFEIRTEGRVFEVIVREL
jgi:hypothetical protein